MRTTEALRLRTNSKVNLFLRVMGRRSDGYHEVETVLHGIALADDIAIEITDSGRVEIDMKPGTGIVGEMPTSEVNIIARVAERYIESGAHNLGLRVHVLKNIPIGAGLGGGSGNAAGAIVVLNEIWNMGLDRDALVELAGAIGADVPYCIFGGTALATGRGEDLTPLPAPTDLWMVLGLSHERLLTSSVYARHDELELTDDASSIQMTLALGGGDPVEIASLLHNDLEPAAFLLMPRLEGLKKEMLEAGALGAVMTGSGPTVVGIVENEERARMVAHRVQRHFDRVLCVHSTAECIERLH